MSKEGVELDVELKVDGAQKQLQKLATDADKAAAAQGAGAASTENWRKKANELKEGLEKQAGALGAVTMLLGQHDDAASKVARGVAGLASAFAAGGPFGVALLVTVAGVNALNEAYDDEIARQEKIIQLTLGAGDKMIASANGIAEALRVLKDERSDEEKQLDSLQAKRKDQIDGLADLNRQMSEVKSSTALSNDEFARAADTQMSLSASIARTEQSLRQLDETEGMLLGRRLAREAEEKDARMAERARAAQARAAQNRRDANASVTRDQDIFGGGGSLEQRIGFDPAALDEMDALIADHDAAAAKIDAQRRATEEAQWSAHYNAVADARFEAHRRAVFQIEALEADLYQNQMPSFAASGISAFQGYLDAKIQGEEDAEQRALAGFLASTGQQLVGIGTKALFEGAAISANPATPGLGAPMIAIGAAAIAAGVGMGAGSAAWTHSLDGGVVGKPLDKDKKEKADRGVNARTSRGGGGSGGSRAPGLTVVNNYGVSGPTAEDQARELARRNTLARQRRFAT